MVILLSRSARRNGFCCLHGERDYGCVDLVGGGGETGRNYITSWLGVLEDIAIHLLCCGFLGPGRAAFYLSIMRPWPSNARGRGGLLGTDRKELCACAVLNTPGCFTYSCKDGFQ